MTVVFAAVWFATAMLLPTAILVLFGRALWLGITAHTLKECDFSGNASKTHLPD